MVNGGLPTNLTNRGKLVTLLYIGQKYPKIQNWAEIKFLIFLINFSPLWCVRIDGTIIFFRLEKKVSELFWIVSHGERHKGNFPASSSHSLSSFSRDLCNNKKMLTLSKSLISKMSFFVPSFLKKKELAKDESFDPWKLFTFDLRLVDDWLYPSKFTFSK